MEINEVSVSKINPAKYNPRGISADAFSGLKESISKFGFVDPVVINKTTGNLISGHQRLKAAIDLGFKKVPAVFVKVDETTEQAMNISLNNPGISGFFTDDIQQLLITIKEKWGDEQFENLNFDNLLIAFDWSSDIEKVNNLDELDSTAPVIIKIVCPKQMEDKIRAAIHLGLGDLLGIEGVAVE